MKQQSDESSGALAVAEPRSAVETASQPFEADTMQAVSAVRQALGAMVAELPGDIRRPRHLQKTLGVDYKICWQVFNVIQAPDPLTAARHTPSAPAIKRFLASGLQLGVSSTRIKAVQTAIEQFSQVVHAHADDRDSFQAMVAAVASNDSDASHELQHRRTAYRCMSQIWGAQTEAHLAAGFVRLSKTGGGTDECLLTIKQGFRRLRPNASPIVYGSAPSSIARKDAASIQVPLNPALARKYRAPLLPEFSSRPLPKLRTEPGGAGWLYTRLATEGIGRQSAVDLGFGVSFRGVPPVYDDLTGKRLVRAGMTFRTPTALLVLDFLVHRPSFGHVTPQAMAFQNMPGDDLPMVAREAPQLVVAEKVIRMGRADQVMSTPEWPRYPELLRYAADILKWDLSEFDVLRLRVQYPVFGSVIRMQFPL